MQTTVIIASVHRKHNGKTAKQQKGRKNLRNRFDTHYSYIGLKHDTVLFIVPYCTW